MSRKKSILRCSSVPLLFEEQRIGSFIPDFPKPLGKDIRFPARPVRNVQCDLPLSPVELVVSNSDAARDLGIRLDYDFSIKKQIVM